MPGPAMLVASTYHLYVCCKIKLEKCKFDIGHYSGKESTWQNPSLIASFWSKILNFLLQVVISRWYFHIFLQAYSGTVLGCLLIRNGSSPSSAGGRVVFPNEFRGSMFSSKKLNQQRDFDVTLSYIFLKVLDFWTAWAKSRPKSQNPHWKVGNRAF